MLRGGLLSDLIWIMTELTLKRHVLLRNATVFLLFSLHAYLS